jgi:hypothetical protein
MAKQFLEIELDVPEGYEAIGYRRVESGETFLSLDGEVLHWLGACKSIASHIIVRKTKKLSDEEATEQTRDRLEALHNAKPAFYQRTVKGSPCALHDTTTVE